MKRVICIIVAVIMLIIIIVSAISFEIYRYDNPQLTETQLSIYSWESGEDLKVLIAVIVLGIALKIALDNE